MFSRCASIYNPLLFIVGFLLTGLVGQLSAQPFGNEWINYDQRYYKFPVWEEGVYRINYNALAAAGIPLGSIDPRSIQVYNREQEVPVYIKGEEDGSFGLTDYIELYATGNDGWIDGLVYHDPDHQTNPYYSLFNDTIYYYVTWENGTIDNLRYEAVGDQDLGEITPLSFVWNNSVLSLVDFYNQGKLDIWGTSTSFYTAGEGWFGPRASLAVNTRSFDVPTPFVYSGGGAPDATIRAVAASNSDATPDFDGGPNHHTQILFGSPETVVYDETYSGYQVIDHEFNVSPSALGSETTVVKFRVIDDLNVAADFISPSNIVINYPMVPQFSGVSKALVSIPSNGSGSLAQFRFSGIIDNPLVYTRGALPQRIEAQQDGTDWQVGITQTGNESIPVYVIAEGAVQTVSTLEPVGAAGNGFFTNFETFNVDSAFVIVSHQQLMDGANAYAQHRNIRFNTFVVGVEELYDQYGGGFEKSGLAIRRFMDFLLSSWDTEPQYLFLLGKSIREASEGISSAGAGARRNQAFFARNLVPSFGYPPSDNLITVGLQGSENLVPAVRTGRLAAESNTEVFDYLNKVVTFENQPPAEWMKNVMHFGGGTSDTEQQSFQNYLEGYASIITDTCFGGIVHPFYKDNNEPISINLSSEITELIDGGVSLMTFFGHASSVGFDQSIDNPENFDWNGRFPFLIGNACFTGDIHQPNSSSTSEQFTLLENKGVIGFLSTVKLGFPGALNSYTSELYHQLTHTNYGKSVGDHIRKTIGLMNPGPDNLIMINQVLGMTLHGDPSIVLNSFDKPDYAIEEGAVSFSPSEVTTVLDSMTVIIDISNIGKATNHSFDVIVERSFPDEGADSVYVITVSELYNTTTLSLTIPVQADRALGENLFSVYLDLPVNAVDEIDDFGNNSLENISLPISTGGIIPVYPYKYAVVADPQVTLKASTGNPIANPRNYRFQADTTRHFNSPFLTQMIINQAGGLVEWPLPYTMTDSTVYFWRVAIDTLPEAMKWQESSFQYIEGKTGWGQAHFHQFHENFYAQLEYNEPERKIDFFSGTVNLRAKVLGNSTSLENAVTLDLSVVEYGGCSSAPALHVCVFDPVTFEAWGTAVGGENPQNNFGNANNGLACRNRVENYFIFRQSNAAEMDAFSNMLLNEIPNDHYVLVYTWRLLVKDNLENTPFYSTMDELGATIDQEVQDSIPYVFLVKKGDLSSAEELFGTSIYDELNLNSFLQASGDEGAMASVRAGPAAQWDSFHYRFRSSEAPTVDSTNVKLQGIQWNNALTDLENTTNTVHSFDEPNLGNLVNAAEFPFLQIRAHLKDELIQTPAQLKRWHLLYDEIPEAVVNPDEHFVFESSDVEQGEEVLVSYAITNASAVDMDSLLVRYWVVNADNSMQEIDLRRIAPLPAGQSIIDSIQFETWGMAGQNQFWLEVNPTNPQTGQYDQLEQYHFNNFLQLGFHVNQDNINPLLDVTFDGLHILDGEIVSARPEISISLTDENMFLMLDQDADTSNFQIFFAEPGGELERHYFYNGSMQNMIWVPASGNTNRFQILYRPEFEHDGQYTMLVRGTDKSGNPSGEKDYRITFEVITQSTITDVLNYPNPFSTKTHFVFTLTGSEVPDYMKIQIMTITGKIVREITHMELGPIRVGRNITDYYWDGTDMYGDRLANGVYLYRVIAKINGQSIDKRETAAGQYFKREFGKMYLMR